MNFNPIDRRETSSTTLKSFKVFSQISESLKFFYVDSELTEI